MTLVISELNQYMKIENKLVVGKMKDEKTGVVIEELVKLKRKIYPY